MSVSYNYPNYYMDFQLLILSTYIPITYTIQNTGQTYVGLDN